MMHAAGKKISVLVIGFNFFSFKVNVNQGGAALDIIRRSMSPSAGVNVLCSSCM